MADEYNKGEGDSALSDITTRRMIGITPDGTPVNNVTDKNRFDVDPRKPFIKIHLMNENVDTLLCEVYIDNTREMPDIVVYRNTPFEVVNTRLEFPQYRQCMVSTAYDSPPQNAEA